MAAGATARFTYNVTAECWVWLSGKGLVACPQGACEVQPSGCTAWQHTWSRCNHCSPRSCAGWNVQLGAWLLRLWIPTSDQARLAGVHDRSQAVQAAVRGQHSGRTCMGIQAALVKGALESEHLCMPNIAQRTQAGTPVCPAWCLLSNLTPGDAACIPGNKGSAVQRLRVRGATRWAKFKSPKGQEGGQERGVQQRWGTGLGAAWCRPQLGKQGRLGRLGRWRSGLELAQVGRFHTRTACDQQVLHRKASPRLSGRLYFWPKALQDVALS